MSDACFDGTPHRWVEREAGRGGSWVSCACCHQLPNFLASVKLADEQRTAIAALKVLCAASTDFRLGRLDDHDPRDFVSVHRQYGVPPHMRWVAVQVSFIHGVLHHTSQSFERQAEALAAGADMLRELRRDQPIDAC